MITAKPVINDQYWILRKDDVKVGNIEAEPGGYSLVINNRGKKFKTLNAIKEEVPINFEVIRTSEQPVDENQVYNYPTSEYPYNAMFDVKHGIPIWTDSEKSKSWFAAGWYLVKTHKKWKPQFCPKLIMLQRYPYHGPFKKEANAFEHLWNIKS